MMTREGLLRMLDTSVDYCTYLHIYPFEATTESVVNRLRFTYPKMQTADILYDDEYIFIPYDYENYGALLKEVKKTVWELTSAAIQMLMFKITPCHYKGDYNDKINIKCYGRYSDDKTTLIEFDSAEDLTAWLEYKDNFARQFHITKDNAIFQRMAATAEEVKKVLERNHTYSYNDTTSEKTLTAE